jgi:hypothetical protein
MKMAFLALLLFVGAIEFLDAQDAEHEHKPSLMIQATDYDWCHYDCAPFDRPTLFFCFNVDSHIFIALPRFTAIGCVRWSLSRGRVAFPGGGPGSEGPPPSFPEQKSAFLDGLRLQLTGELEPLHNVGRERRQL